MISVQSLAGGRIVLRVDAETIESRNVAKFKEALKPHVVSDARVTLDLGQVEFMDSSGLGALLTFSRAIEGRGGGLQLASLTPPVRTLFELVRLHRVFDIINDVSEAA